MRNTFDYLYYWDLTFFSGKVVFGVPLEVATKNTRLPDGVELPRIFREGIVHIEENGK